MAVTAVVAALGSALLVAAANVLQHRAGQGSDATKLTRVLARPLWLVGAAAGVTGFGLHVLALSSGSLSVVQPLLVCGLLFALPMGWLLERRSARWLELGAAATVVAGLIIFQTSARAAIGRSTASLVGLGWCTTVGLAIVVVGLVVAARYPTYRASWLGFCAGAAYGLLAALLKTSVGTFAADQLGVLSTWPVYAFVVIVAGAIAVNQIAFNAGPLAASLPLVTIVDPLVSVVVGSVAFGETTASGPLAVAGQLGGFAMMGLGVVILSRRVGAPSSPAGQPDCDLYVAAEGLAAAAKIGKPYLSSEEGSWISDGHCFSASSPESRSCSDCRSAGCNGRYRGPSCS